MAAHQSVLNKTVHKKETAFAKTKAVSFSINYFVITTEFLHPLKNRKKDFHSIFCIAGYFVRFCKSKSHQYLYLLFRYTFYRHVTIPVLDENASLSGIRIISCSADKLNRCCNLSKTKYEMYCFDIKSSTSIGVAVPL